MFLILTIFFILNAYWLFNMMIDLANNGLGDIMLKTFLILVYMSVLFTMLITRL